MFTSRFGRGTFPTKNLNWRALFGAGLLVFLPLWPVFAYDGYLELPRRPTGRVEDVNRNPTLVPSRRIAITYGGNVIFRFPNYSFRIVNYRDGSLPDEGFGGILFHNEAGMAWDGQGLILTPNYPSSLLTENRYVRGVIGDPQVCWPSFAPSAVEPAELPVWPPEFPPLVGYRGLEPTEIGDYRGPNHGPMPAPPLVQESYLEPLKPKLGDDGKIHYVPARMNGER